MGSFLEILENIGSHFQENSSSKKIDSLYRDLLNNIFNNNILGILEGLGALGEDSHKKKKRVSFSNFPRMVILVCYLLEDKELVFLETIYKTFQDSKKALRRSSCN